MNETKRCNRCGSKLQPEEKAVCEACLEQGKELLETVRESEEFEPKRQDNRILDEEDD